MLEFSLTKSVRKAYQPKKSFVGEVIQKSLITAYKQVYLDIAIVSLKASQELNQTYRNINKPTNVIALEYPDTREKFTILNGEIILCDNIIITEALAQNKDVHDHYIHMLVHGLLHLQGFDHVQKKDQANMEKQEIKILQGFNITNPYITK